ncbi:NAD(P)/FAD-dependent oxidoreductase [Mycolicibacterium sediminis]|uniref:Pyridine nucleotide-disulfide oxidoreductase n=1 Tax=Mycolicibacterium sediminis TaxID=1286180 RepID=A0A7I7QP12_9MYCO|nr:NAD(P)/FAD-dependent oxidoreductase [Mycolicibacterium sediminis]BBY28054.1 hypothetical protein MSEDJ_21500 [Mycolicibacterium sediminis]
MTTLETDYLVVGAGAMGMAFVDTLLTETSASVVLVDTGLQPGGHWLASYPFVRLHQPSAYYGVNSRPFGDDVVDASGWNEGFYELATGSEICAYFEQVMRHQMLPTGRLTYLPMTRYLGDDRIRTLDGAEQTVTVRKRVVDATYLLTTVPSMRPPPFPFAADVDVVAPNDLPRNAAGRDRFTIVGAGKTGMDACIWLLRNGIPPDRIRWVMPRDSWLMNRATVQPGPRFMDQTRGSLGTRMQASVEATSLDDLFARLEADGNLLRIDPTVTPTMYHCAIVSLGELEQLRRIDDVVRLGHVEKIEPDQVILQAGTVPAEPGTLYVDCTASGLSRPPAVPVFDDGRLVLQSVRGCQQVFSSAFIAHVEHAYGTDEERNALCEPVPHPDAPLDWLRVAIADFTGQARWLRDPELTAWLESARLNILRGMFADLPTEPETRRQTVDAVAGALESCTASLGALLQRVD